MFHHLAYALTTGGAIAVLTDVPAVNDTVFSQQGNHFIFTDDMVILGTAALGATLTGAQIFSPSLLPFGLFWIWPINTSLTPPSFPRLFDTRARPFVIPKNEQIQMLMTDTANEIITGHMWVAPRSWNRNLVNGQRRSILQCTATAARVAKSWGGLAPVTFTNQPQGGWYTVNAAYCLDTLSRAFRLYFPRSPGSGTSGRQLRPGDLVSHASGDMLVPNWANNLGPWGAFHSFEPLQIEVLADAAGAGVQTLFLDVDYMGQGDAGGAYPLQAA